MTLSEFRIGARGSPLSQAQTRWVRTRLARALAVDEDALPIDAIQTTGDVRQEGRLQDAGGKGLFTKELDDALLMGRIDIGVHSLKDVPAILPDGIVLACTPPREDPRDAFVSLTAKRLEDLPAGACMGTASLRRQAQTLHARPDLRVEVLRGNVDTRLKKLEEGVADATYLAISGLKRLGLEARASHLMDPHAFPPAPCQGALALTVRADDARALQAAQAIEDANARLEIEAERAFLAALDGSCRTPIGALARTDGNSLSFVGEILTPDGAKRWRREQTIQLQGDSASLAAELGKKLGEEIRAEAGEVW